MSGDRVARRHVFFLSGFDPKGASYYHGLYAREAALQARITGSAYEVGPRVRAPNGNSLWPLRHEDRGCISETTFEYVRWDDIVRAQWPRRAVSVLAGSLRGYRAALASWSALRKVWQASPRTLVALAMPAAFWLVAILLGLGLGLGVAALLGPALPAPAAWLAGAATASALGWGVLKLETRLGTSWLLRIYQFAGAWCAGRVGGLDARLDALARDIRARLADPSVDEVLLVGFSVGSMLAASAASRLHAMARSEGNDLSRLSLVTLGNCIPLLGLMKGAHGFRAELARLGEAPRLHWVDFSSPTDWGSFALVDPLALCLGPGGDNRPHAPQMASPRFHMMFEPAQYAQIVKNKRRIHMQYLMAGERPTLYDYFAITAGPQRLQDRLGSLPAP
jgi:hypothetical protein